MFILTLHITDSTPLSLLQKPDKPGRWSTPGVNIDIDNLLTSPPKSTSSTSAPSMNQLAQSGTGTMAQTQFAGPNYNVDTTILMGQRPPLGGPRPGMAPQIGMGMGYNNPGMGYGGVRPMYGTGYAATGGYGTQPMGFGGYGYTPSGYGGMMRPSMNSMGMQPRPM